MKYKVLTRFVDLQDANHLYKAGDTFPRSGLTVSADRIAELSSSSNRRGIPLIEEVQAKVEKTEPVEDAPKKRGRKTAK